jgi:acetyltransferase-like isoleucine patch superfamily enzyme
MTQTVDHQKGKHRGRRLLELLKAVFSEEAARVQTQWNRTLPFADYVVDRWQKAQMLGFGEKSSIYDSSLVLGSVTVGKNTWIGPFTLLDGSGGLTIGDNCSISAGVQIYTHDTVAWATSGGEKPPQHAPVSVGDHCYIGPNVIISKGVKIGNRCIIGANSFVNSDVPDDAKAWGTPAKVQQPKA